jgi:group I intron endonuclease
MKNNIPEILRNKSGIYKISNTVNSKIYIGSAVNFSYRFSKHKHHLTNGKHHSIVLQNHVNKYGLSTLLFDLIELCDVSILYEREQFFINEMLPVFNICLSVKKGRFGFSMSNEAKLKAKETKIKNGTFDRMSKDMSERNKGNKNRLGKKLSEESKNKISVSNKGKKRTPEQIEILREKSTGRKHTEESKEKMRLKAIGNKANLGRINSEETKKRMSDAAKKRYNK